MTIVTIRKSGGIWKGFTSIGHADYGQGEPDIVCAAISVLLLNTINSIDELAKNNDVQVVDNEKEGLLYFELKTIPDEKTELLLDSMLLGLTDISNQYKKNVKLKFEEV